MILTRFALFHDRTLGKLFYEDEEYYTIENPWLNNQPNISCIPEGDYTMIRVDSPKYGANMWEISNVEDRTHILIHVANFAKDVRGCIGFGSEIFANLEGVAKSRDAINKFYQQTKDYNHLRLTIRSGAIV
jgi:hypothetical protein|tara:strand:+ start:697 stop:1089 length:393 start_codon:yes stop_codon:yes gene_type:complete